MLNKVLSTRAGSGFSLLRAVAGIVFAAHGAQKLFGLFGGYGLEGTGQYMESIGLHPGFVMALIAGSIEFLGGLSLIIGLLSRVAAIGLTILSAVALFSVHISHGFFMSAGGFEYIMTLMVISIAVIIEGSGKWSLDYILNKKVS